MSLRHGEDAVLGGRGTVVVGAGEVQDPASGSGRAVVVGNRDIEETTAGVRTTARPPCHREVETRIRSRCGTAGLDHGAAVERQGEVLTRLWFVSSARARGGKLTARPPALGLSFDDVCFCAPPVALPSDGEAKATGAPILSAISGPPTQTAQTFAVDEGGLKLEFTTRSLIAEVDPNPAVTVVTS